MKILFVCTGNTCRSPLAEAIARKIAIERGLTDVEAISAGTSAHEGAPASDGALLVGLERNMDLAPASRADAHARSRATSPTSSSPWDRTTSSASRRSAAAGRAYLLTDYASRGASIARDQRSDRRRARRLPRDRRRARGRDSPRPRSHHGGARHRSGVMRAARAGWCCSGTPSPTRCRRAFQNAALARARAFRSRYEALDVAGADFERHRARLLRQDGARGT